jgi:hypothetical protein
VGGGIILNWILEKLEGVELPGLTLLLLLLLLLLILPAALGTCVHSAFNRNESQKKKNNVSGEQSAAGV